MAIERVKHLVKRSIELGLLKVCAIISRRVRDRCRDVYWRSRAISLRAHVNWSAIKRQHQFSGSLADFLNDQTKSLNCLPFLLNELGLNLFSDKWKTEAGQILNNNFKILSDRSIELPELEWHTDFRLRNQNSQADFFFSPATYYKEIAIKAHHGLNVGKDIKIPWELGRLHHLTVLAYVAHQQPDERYITKIKAGFSHWYTKNPPLLGPQWVCPMDVGIRAVNLVWTFLLAEKYIKEDLQFTQTYVSSLYDHLCYLERNWEIYDYKTSNHYLADLIGYFYLCYFFKNLNGVRSKAEWCFKELLRELDKQVFAEGTDYEGSTAYHSLVTEFFYHALLIAQLFNFEISQEVKAKIERMIGAISWWTPHNGKPIFIGDEDGGKLLPFGLTAQLLKRYTPEILNSLPVKEFSEFGLSIFKDLNTHITLRHHAYTTRQPSGHFHIDVGSLTLAYKGVQLFTDPGSYVYTPSVEWRNLFRSAQMHSTNYVVDKEAIPLNDTLFLLNLPEQLNESEMFCDATMWQCDAINRLYVQYGWLHRRTVQFERAKKSVKITDLWQKLDDQKDAATIGCTFMLGHEIAVQENGVALTLLRDAQPYATVESEWNLSVEDTWVSLGYGSKVASKKLRAQTHTAGAQLQKITRVQLLS